jgi:lipoprotein-anchoring transpeptidase ErfK/SrfK
MKAHEAISEGLLLLSAAILAAMLPQAASVKAPAVSAPQAAPVVAAPAALPVSSPATPVLQTKEQPRKAMIPPKPYQHVRTVVVSLPDRRLALIEDGRVKRVYTVAVGKASTPSPTGTFTILARVTNPTYYHDGQVVPPGPANPVGDRWMSLSKAGYGIHGTNAPRSIGHAASHGCIRMARTDLEQLFAQVRTGDTVEILGERDEQTAALFGTPETAVTPAAAVVARNIAEPSAPEASVAAVLPAGQ